MSNILISSIEETHAALKAGEITVEALTKQCLDAIKELNPKINAILAINERALEDARRLDVGCFSYFI
jgi:Asp-tRNA(Asn)/Glu-tRNA(Gln) amidotransferase A subunit family amidase